ncbi:MAG: ATP-dependent DNA helicase RecG [Anaerolineae bacterium]|nr:ATP-dependent DNA helicase RecG [Anaerolineae bacterium]
MKPSIEKLQKFFRLEADRDYDNRAVMGGLESMLDKWEAEARADELPEDLIQAVTIRLRDYPRLSEDTRKEALKGLWRRIKKQTSAGEADEEDTPEAENPPGDQSLSEAASKPPKQPKEPTKTSKTPSAVKEKKQRPRPTPEGPAAALNAPVTVLDGVGPANAEKLANLGMHSLGDMLYHFPRRYDDYTLLKPIKELKYGEEVTVIATVQTVNTRQIRGGKSKIVEVIVNDGSGALRLNWFNQPWVANSLTENTQLVLSGKIEQYLGRLVMNSPEWELLEKENLHTNRIVPVYPLTAKITQRWLRQQMNKVVNYWALRVQDPIPESVRKSADLYHLPEALLQAHFPESWEDLKAAQERLAFDEIFMLQLGVLRQKREWQQYSARVFAPPQEWLQAQIARLPYTLTGAQDAALQNVKSDLSSGHPMNRLLQGDVGSGKTVIAALAVAMVTQEGAQAALMAPTSILAEQHYRSLTSLLAGENGFLNPDQIHIMVGATAEAEKQSIRDGLESGQIKLVIGTHALIEDPVNFADLQLAIIDEQHRFGVDQRAALRAKGDNPHLLVMTATPIPRSLALTIYGDLDLTVMDEIPPGRQPVATHLLFPRERERAYSLIRSQIEAGSQAFIIYPLVEESDNSDAKAAVEEHERLQTEVFPDLKLGLLHGRLKAAEKEEVMLKFHNQEFDILVSTTVVEVGVDIPNATVMLIEGANRFGLAQMHQLRGRVGRGQSKAYCLLVPETDNAVENERLQAMTESNDGFILAERDLEQRGPGQFLGTRQSGFSDLQIAAISNVRLIEKARQHATDFLAADPELTHPEHQLLARTLAHFWRNGKGDIS